MTPVTTGHAPVVLAVTAIALVILLAAPAPGTLAAPLPSATPVLAAADGEVGVTTRLLAEGELLPWPLRSGSTSLPPGTPARNLTSDFVTNGDLPEGDTPAGICFTPDGTTIVVAHRDTRNLILFDAATRIFLAEIQLSGSPNDVAVSADGTRAVTANVFEATASIIDLTAGSEIAVVPVGNQPGLVRISPDGSMAVIGNTADGSVSVIDIGAASEVRRIDGIGFIGTISLAFESGAITAQYKGCEFAGNTTIVQPDFYADLIHLVDITNGAVISLPCADQPREVAVTPDGSLAVVTHSGNTRLLSLVDVAGASIAQTISVTIDLWGPVCVNPTGTRAAVAVQNACRIIDLTTGGSSGNLNTASVNGLLTTADGAHALVVGYSGSLIDFATASIVNQLNNVISTPVGAVSPIGPRAAMVANTFGEDMVVVNTAGAGGSTEGIVPSGPPPEGDKARSVAISPDGSKAVILNILSDNATIVDLDTPAVEAIVEVGNRPSEVAISPDGGRAVVANLDDSFVSIIDLVTHGVTQVGISTRGSQVEISPDGVYAYVAVVVSDGVWRLNLVTQSVEGPRLSTGNMGGILYMFNQSSGMTLSHDGQTLVTCNSFDDSISMIDTSSWSVVATVSTGDFPVRARFAADDSQIYVTHRDDNTLRVVSNAGAGSAVIGTVPVGDWPFEMALSPDGNTLYVANFQDERIGVVDLPGGVMTTTYWLPSHPAGLELAPGGGSLYVATGNYSVTLGPGPLFSINMEGAISVLDTSSGAITDQVVTDLPPAMLAYNAVSQTVGVPSPFGDGLTLVDIGGTTGIESAGVAPPFGFAMRGPNPLAGGANLEITLTREAAVRLAIFDVAGRHVATLIDGILPAGEQLIRWDGRSAGGSRAGAGVYFARLTAGGTTRTAKLIMVE